MPTNNHYKIGIITWNEIIVYRLFEEYLKPYNCVQIVCINNAFNLPIRCWYAIKQLKQILILYFEIIFH